jgi:hypothetical protein
MSDIITVIRETTGKMMAKVINSPTDISDYDNGWKFDYADIDISNLDDLYTVFDGIKDDPTCCVIRGQGIHLADARRNNFNTKDIPHNWIMIDFDKVDIGPDYDEHTCSEAVIKKYLPTEFHNVSYIWQHSSKAGLFSWDVVSGHAFFWLDKQWTNADLNAWAKSWNKSISASLKLCDPKNPKLPKNVIDPRLFQRVQAHYTATPIFTTMTDPVAKRLVLVRKTNALDIQRVDNVIPITEPVEYTYEKVALNYAKPLVISTGVSLPSSYKPSKGDLEETLAIIKSYYNRPEYDDWIKFTWAVCKVLGKDAGKERVKELWSEEVLGEYDEIIGQYVESRSPGLAHLIAVARSVDPTFFPTDCTAVLKARIEEIKSKSIDADKGIPTFTFDEAVTDVLEKTENTWLWTTQYSGAHYQYIEGECGQGKSEWMLNRVGNAPGRYIIALPKIDVIVEMSKRLEKLFGDLRACVGYQFKTIHSDGKVLRDEDDTDSDDFNGRMTVQQQLAEFKAVIDKGVDGKRYPYVVLFITHAAMTQTDWSGWNDFEIIIDEIPDVYINYVDAFYSTHHVLKDYVEVIDEISNFYQLGLTQKGVSKFEKDGKVDRIESSIEGLLESINNKNLKVYANKQTWNNSALEKISFLRLLDPGFLTHFKSVIILGDEFTKSLMYLVWKKTFDVEFTAHPDWKPARKRMVPLKKRVFIHYWSDADENERRASKTLFDSDANILGQMKDWTLDNVCVGESQSIITTPSNHKKKFDLELPPEFRDVVNEDTGGIDTVCVIKSPPLRWLQPKVHGLDKYKGLRKAVWMAAMRPSGLEVAFLSAVLGITEEEIIYWREYNSLYQYVMRIALRDYESGAQCHVYVWDLIQAKYLEGRFGGSLGLIKESGISGIETSDYNRRKSDEERKAAKQLSNKKQNEKLKAAKQAAGTYNPNLARP